MRARLDISKLSPAFGSPEGAQFVAVMPPAVLGEVEFFGEAKYKHTLTINTCDYATPTDLLASLDSAIGSHVLWISTETAFRSPPQSAVLSTKLGVLPFFSTGYSVQKLRAAFDLLISLDYHAQERNAQRLIAGLSSGLSFRLVSPQHGTNASIELKDSLYFFDQSGPIGWGQQSVLPGGEVSILTDAHGSYSNEAKFDLSGELALAGFIVLHRGLCPCHINRSRLAHGDDCSSAICSVIDRLPVWVSDADHRRTFEQFKAIREGGAIVNVANGIIDRVRPIGRSSAFASAIEAFIEEEPNYAKVHEIGFGLNDCEGFFRYDNFLPNEMRRGIHFGLGLTPYTPFHLDIVCPDVQLLLEAGEKGLERVF